MDELHSSTASSLRSEGRSGEEKLNRLAMSPGFLLKEFFDSISPLAAHAVPLSADDRHDFYLRVLPLLISHCRSLGLRSEYETSLFIVRTVEEAVAVMTRKEKVHISSDD